VTGQDYESDIRAAAALLRRSHHAVALTGAGLSAESGIPTYRGPDGVWTKFGEPTIDGWDLFCEDPEAWWKHAIESRVGGSEFSEAIDRAVPNPGHYVMAELEHMGRWRTSSRRTSTTFRTSLAAATSPKSTGTGRRRAAWSVASARRSRRWTWTDCRRSASSAAA